MYTLTSNAIILKRYSLKEVFPYQSHQILIINKVHNHFVLRLTHLLQAKQHVSVYIHVSHVVLFTFSTWQMTEHSVETEQSPPAALGLVFWRAVEI